MADDRRLLWATEEYDRVLAFVLRAGVAISAGVVLLGGIMFLVQHGGEAPDYHLFRDAPDDVRLLGAIVSGVGLGNPRSIIQLGVLLLIGTPIARVVAAAIGFVRHRDWLYTGVTLTVLMFLLYSLTIG